MDFFHFFSNTSAVPWLPEPSLARWALHGAWGLLLAAAAWRIGRAFGTTWRALAASLLLVWTLWPGSASPAYWLGLAFQSPSLMSVWLCLLWAVPTRPALRVSASMGLALAGVLLGWVLLLDLLAFWPVSVYAWGFGRHALLLLCAVTALLWLGGTVCNGAQRAALSLAALLALFVLTRLPTGNLWDALLDPWLWLLLQLGLGHLRHRRTLRRLRHLGNVGHRDTLRRRRICLFDLRREAASSP